MSLHEIERVICKETPQKPSLAVLHAQEPQPAEHRHRHALGEARDTTPCRLRRRLEGDLDIIVLRSLRMEPERRYASVGELADHIRRHLERRPVEARPIVALPAQ